MRRMLPGSLVLVALALTALPAAAQTSQPQILTRPPMDVGADQVGTLANLGEDLLYPAREQKFWFDVGASYPVGSLQDQNWDAGLLLRMNHQFWRRDAFRLNASLGVHFANDSYFNDAQEDLAFSGSVSDIQTRHYLAWPAMVDLQLVPAVTGSIQPVLSAGPGVVWTSEALITSAVNDGVGSTGGDDDVLIIGPGGEQGISPYVIRTRSRFNLGWNARAGVGFKVSEGQRPLWVRAVVSGVTYYQHTAPRTVLGFAASFGR